MCVCVYDVYACIHAECIHFVARGEKGRRQLVAKLEKLTGDGIEDRLRSERVTWGSETPLTGTSGQEGKQGK